MPLLTAGDDSPMPCSTAYFHSTLPSARLSASRCPDPTPTNTRPSAIAAEDSTASPASYDQATLRVGESGPAAIPVRAGPPRNCGHVSGAGAWAAATATEATTTELVRSCLTMPSRRFLAPRVRRTGAD